MNLLNINLTVECIPSLLLNYTQDNQKYQIGKTKVFLKRDIYEKIINENKIIVNEKVILIQKNIRRFINQKKYNKFISFIKNIQIKWKHRFLKKIRAINIIKNRIRTYIIRLNYIKFLNNVVKIQSYVRMFISKLQYKRLTSIIKIQSNIRMINDRKKYLKYIIKHRSIIKIQNQYRIYKNNIIERLKLISLGDLN